MSHRKLYRNATTTAAILFAASLATGQSNAQNQVNVRGQVLDGTTPAANVSVLFFKRVYDGSTEPTFIKIGDATTQDDGKFSVAISASELAFDRASPVLHLAVDDNKTILGGMVYYIQPTDQVILPKPIALSDFVEQEMKLVDQSGDPIEDAEFEITGFGNVPFAVFRSNSGRQPHTEYIELPTAFRESARSDKEGRVKISRVPEACYTTAKIKLPNGTRFWVGFGPGAQTMTFECTATFSGQITSVHDSFDRTQTKINAYCTAVFHESYVSRGEVEFFVDTDGSVTADHVPPGSWSFYISSLDDRFYTRDSRFTVEALSGSPATIPEVEFNLGIPVGGTVVSAETEKGIPNVGIHLSVTRPDATGFVGSFNGKTDENGKFVGWVPPGTVRIRISQTSSEYCAPREDEFETDSIDTSTGEASYEFPPFKLRKAVRVSGHTVDETGNAVGGASIHVLSNSYTGPSQVVYSNSVGEFEIPGVDPMDFIVLRGKAGDAVTKGGIVVDPAENEGMVELALSNDHAFTVAGRIVDSSGDPIPGLSVDLRGGMNYVSRFRSGGRGTGAGQFTTDEKGRFESDALYDGDRYRLTISFEGYANYNSPEVVGQAGSRHDFGTIQLARTNLAATGQVVDSSGEPVAGATVFNSGDAPKKVSTTTDDDGRFELEGLPERSYYLFVHADGFKFSSFLVESFDQPMELELVPATDSTRDSRLLPYTYDERKELCAYMLKRLYSLPPDKRQPIDFVILRYLARVDPDAAMELIPDPANVRYRQDVTIEVARAIIDTAPDEAMAMFTVADSGSFFYRVLETANRLAPSSPDIAMRLAENLAIRLEKVDPPNKIYNIAQLGRLLTDLGLEEAGEKYYLEAVNEAKKLTGNEREAFVLGFTAEQIASWNLDIALELVDSMKQSQGTSRERHLGNIAVAIAATNPEKALEILTENAQTRRAAPNVAFQLAKNSVEYAEQVYQLLAESGQEKEAAEVLLAIALATADNDPQYAFQQLDRVYEIAMRHSQDFESWVNYGFEAPLVGLATASANAMNHPDVNTLIAKALASRRGTSQTRGEVYSLKASVRLAKYLAFADRRVSRHLLSQIEERQDLLGGGGYATFGTDEWLIAWSLTDIEKAKQIFDELLAEEAKKEVMNQGDLTRIFMYLTLPDEEFLRQVTRMDGLSYPGRE